MSCDIWLYLVKSTGSSINFELAIGNSDIGKPV
jgi:hypothetical protein